MSCQPTNSLWNVTHVDNPVTGVSELEERFQGLVNIEYTDNQKYLGFTLSNKNNNMININEMKKKSIWIIKKIFTRLESLNLKKYYFECALVFLDVMLRSSILYASECYYNLKEKDIRSIERIEEDFLRKLFKTTKGCPISQLYLEAGFTPARFAIKKTKILFLKYILHEDPESMIYKFLQLQIKNPTKGDWAYSCFEDLDYLEINLSLKEIKAVTVNKLITILTKSIDQKAFQYLMNMRGSKGEEIIYSDLIMANYLMPNEENMTISDKRYIFSMRNRMLYLPQNVPSRER